MQPGRDADEHCLMVKPDPKEMFPSYDEKTSARQRQECAKPFLPLFIQKAFAGFFMNAGPSEQSLIH